MGQSNSVPENHWYTNLTFETNSLGNNVITLDDLSLRYHLSTPSAFFRSKLTTITRRDRGASQDVPVAEWEKRILGSDHIMMLSGRGTGGRSVPMKEFLSKSRGWSSDKLSFTASNGIHYTWKARPGSLQLYRTGDDGYPVASLIDSSFFGGRKMHIKLTNECNDILDEIVVTCIIAEKMRRDSRSASAGGASAAGPSC